MGEEPLVSVLVCCLPSWGKHSMEACDGINLI